MVQIATAVGVLREVVAGWRRAGERVGLVPTMGALHDGHISLVAAAKGVADKIIVSIFVNPTQFAPTEDFSSYPRTFEADCARVSAAGGDFVYAPGVSTMYPHGFATTINLAGPAKVGLEDRFRPTHFDGVAIVVTKLLLQALPDIAVFGEKDFQQLRVIERVARDLDLPIGILAVPTLREADGLALSSRNVYLTADERRRAPTLQKALAAASLSIGHGGDARNALAEAETTIEAAGFAIDYVEARHAATLGPLLAGEPGRLLVAARLGRTRLIDNVAISWMHERADS